MGNRVFPFFSAMEINTLDDYERFYHTRSYIQNQSSKYRDPSLKQNPVVLDLMEKSGYRKLHKFRNHRKDWDNARGKAPLGYLNAIGVDLKILESCVEADKWEYDRALHIPLFPRFVVVRYMAGIYGDMELPENTSEYAAIEMVKDYSREHGKRCCINYPELKTVWIEPNGDVNYSYYRPSIRFTKDRAIFGSDGSGIGTLII